MKMELSKSRVCNKCNNSTELSGLKLMPNGQKDYVLVCKGCSDTVKNGGSAVAHEQHASPTSAKTLLICGHCRYKFRADLDQAGRSFNLRCQYCDKKDQLYTMQGEKVLM